MSKETGISAYKIYKWLDGKGNPKHEDAQKLEEWLSPNLEESPQKGTSSTPPLIMKLLAEKEAAIIDIKAMYADAKSDKERLFNIIEGYLKDVHSNSKSNQQYLELIVRILRSGESVLFASLDRLEHKQPGTHAKEADRVELTAAQNERKIGKSK